MTVTATTTPRVWIGCLNCYNDGALIGEWFDAIDADEVTVSQLHVGSGRNGAPCEELWVMDHENMPIPGEMDPLTAAAWGRCLDEVEEHLRPALTAWVRSGSYVAEGTGDLPSLPAFEERYGGEWDSFEQYAEQLAEDIGLLAGVSEEVARYFAWDRWARDLAFDYTCEDAPGSGVFVFRDL